MTLLLVPLFYDMVINSTVNDMVINYIVLWHCHKFYCFMTLSLIPLCYDMVINYIF